MLTLPAMPLPLVVVVGGLVLAAPVAFLLLRPRGRTLVLSSWPHPVWLCIQALIAASKLSSKRKDAPDSDKPIQVMLDHAVHFSTSRLRRYLNLAGFTEGTGGDVPLMYPLVEGFRLFMQALLLPAFPLNVLGSVLAKTRVVALRRIAADEKLMFSCRVNPGIRTTAKGHREVDVVVEAHCVGPQTTRRGVEEAGRLGGGAGEAQLVWRSSTTVIIPAPRKGKAPAGPAAADGQSATAAAESAKPTVVDTWKLGPDTGRRYGLLNGDLNPIHLYPVTSVLFGFKRPIAHALFLTGKAEASLRKAGLELRYPCALTAEFKRPTLLPATLHCAWLGAEAAAAGSGGGGDAAASLDSPQGARFAVRTSDLSKEVLVGSVSCNQKAVDEALAV